MVRFSNFDFRTSPPGRRRRFHGPARSAVAAALWLGMGVGAAGQFPDGRPADDPPPPADAAAGGVKPADEPRPYLEALAEALAKRRMKLETVSPSKDTLARRVLADYGAMFMAAADVGVPSACVFRDEKEVEAYQKRLSAKSETIGGITVKLQAPAMDALQAARAEARDAGLDITPRGGPTASRRGYADTVGIRKSRVDPGLKHWQQAGRLSAAEAKRVGALPPREQAVAVLKLEADGLWFCPGFTMSILYDVAAPGTSQHLSMLALDVTEHANPRVREILYRHGWFQTVRSDRPHFTYLGVEEAKLPSLGLRKDVLGGQIFWFPNVEPAK